LAISDRRLTQQSKEYNRKIRENLRPKEETAGLLSCAVSAKDYFCPVNSRVLAIGGLSCLCVMGGALAQGPPDTNCVPCVLQPLLPPPAQTRDLVPFSVGEQLGKAIFFDHTLSNPEGYACATCHIPQAGFTGPSSAVNILFGPVPGVVPGRAGRRKPQSIPYATFSPAGPYLSGGEGGTYVGGDFWDGRTPGTAEQARMPFLDQNEMANTPVGPFPPHAGGYSPLVVQKLTNRPYTPLFETVFGSNVFTTSTDQEVYDLMTSALAMYEASPEINQFSSKYDASPNGTPQMNLYTLTASEENGRALFFGAAQCFQCHSAATLRSVSQVTQGKETFTMYCYANIGVPKNPGNPYYNQTNCDTNPEGCNALGTNFIDYGLGANPNPAPDGTLFMSNSPGDIPKFRGLFKAPSLRNVDRRPRPDFVKSYMHNGVFKSLAEVVHFYNKRNIATNSAGCEVSFNLMVGPPAGFTPIFPPPEVMENLQNLSGYSPSQAAESPPPGPTGPGDGDSSISYNGQVGNLQLTTNEEADLVNFLKALTDGYTHPHPVNVSSSLTALPVQRVPGSFVVQLAGSAGQSYVLQTSTNLTAWSTISTVVLTSPSVNITNRLMPGAGRQFWRAFQRANTLKGDIETGR
jgi:cytochrome c peroxidase